MNIKGAFKHVSRNSQMRKMKALGVDGDLVRWTGSFMMESKLSLVVDGYQCEEVEVETGVPQGSPVSLILFVVYLSRIFKEVEKEVEGCTATLYADGCG